MPALGGFVGLRSLTSRADDDDNHKKGRGRNSKKKTHDQAQGVDPGGQLPGDEPVEEPAASVPGNIPATGLDSAPAENTEPIQLTVIEVLPTTTISSVVQVATRPTASPAAGSKTDEISTPDTGTIGALGLPAQPAAETALHPSVAICEPGVSLCATAIPTGKGSARTASDNRSGAASSPNMIAPIVGSVLGGLVIVLAIIIGVIFYVRRRRKTHVAPSAQYMSSKGSDAASFRRLPSDYSSSRSNSSLGMRDPAESLRGGSPFTQYSQFPAGRY